MLGEQAADLAVVLIGYQTHRDFRVSFRRNDRLGAFAGISAPNAVYVERRPHADALHGRVPLLARRFPHADALAKSGLAERSPAEIRPLRRRELPHPVVEPGDGHAAVGIGQRRDHLREHDGRIGHRSAVQARVQIAVGSRNGHLYIAQAPQAASDRRHVPAEHAGIRNENHIGTKELLVPGAPCRNARRADLFLSLDHELDVARQLAGRNHRLQRLDMHERLPLVVVGPAPPNTSVAQNRLERVGLPLVERIDRHHVVVTVHEHGRRSRIDDLLAVNDRIAVGRHHLGSVGAGGKKRVAQMLGATDHIAPVRAVGAD